MRVSSNIHKKDPEVLLVGVLKDLILACKNCLLADKVFNQQWEYSRREMICQSDSQQC